MKKLLRKSCGAFTMAEILISLTIIGVIAAITLPSLRANINEKTWATQKKALHARMSQAVALLESANSYATAEAFVTDGLSEVLKINNICAGTNVADCGITTGNIIMANGSTLAMPTTWNALGLTGKTFTNASNASASYEATDTALTAAFETVNGESVLVFYNPDCIPDNDDDPSVTADMFPYVCANLIYDLNNDKGPNTVGKDIGYMTIFYATDSAVAMSIPAAADSTTACPDTERLPNVTEAVSMEVNAKLLPRTAATITSGRGIDSAGATRYYSVAAKTAAGVINRTSSAANTAPASNAARRCVKR